MNEIYLSKLKTCNNHRYVQFYVENKEIKSL